MSDYDELKKLAEAATPGPWFEADWRNDFGEEKTTIETRHKEVLYPGQSSIWPDGVECRQVADTEYGNNPLPDAKFIAAANPAAILALIAENERLNSCMKWEQNRAERIGTHGAGCESWGLGHYECLLRERDQLRAEVEMLRKDADRYRWLRAYRLAMTCVDGYECSHEHLDAAIDAAMSQEGNRDDR